MRSPPRCSAPCSCGGRTCSGVRARHPRNPRPRRSACTVTRSRTSRCSSPPSPSTRSSGPRSHRLQLSFLGGASTVTGSRFLLSTARAQILIDCGMFQGSPNETIRNRVPLGFEPKEVDAILVTHAHLDHCGLLPVAVKEGYAGPIYLTSATAELVEIVLLDSGRLQEEFSERHARWERRHPTEAVAADKGSEK